MRYPSPKTWAPTKKIWLLMSFTSVPVPEGPSHSVSSLPKHTRTSLTRSNAASFPEGIRVRLPASAPILPPETGQSRKSTLEALQASNSSLVTPALLVDRSTTTKPADPFVRMPFGPFTTAREASGVGKDNRTASQASATPAGSGASIAPASTSRWQAARSRSATVSSWPPARMWRAHGPPMFPSPMKPILISEPPTPSVPRSRG